MALKLQALTDHVVTFISSKDSSIKSPENYQKYVETADESLLNLEGEPTRFHLKLSSKLKDVLASKDGMTAIAMKAREGGELPVYSLMYHQVKVALKDIKTGDLSEMRVGPDGLASDDLMAALAANDILPELFAALQAGLQNRSNETAKKE